MLHDLFFSPTGGRRGKRKSEPALPTYTALNSQMDKAAAFVTAKADYVCGDPLFKRWQHIIDQHLLSNVQVGHCEFIDHIKCFLRCKD